jgi:hypothetical protein
MKGARIIGQFSKMIYVQHEYFSKNTANIEFITINQGVARDRKGELT